MFKSILNATDVVNATSVDSLVLDVLIILGVVVAGALILYFVWEGVRNLLGKNRDQDVNPVYYAQENKEDSKQKDVLVANYTLQEQNENVVDEEKLSEVDPQQAEAEKAEAEEKAEEDEKEIAERRAYLEARRQELIRRMQAQMNEDKRDEEPEAEQEEEPEEEEETEEEDEQQQALAEEAARQAEQFEAERRALAEEKARYAAMVRELEQTRAELEQQRVEQVKASIEKERLEQLRAEVEQKKAEQAQREQQAKQPEVVPVTTIVKNTIITKNGALTLDELREKLAEAEQRLRDTEKEFKQCKKEYTPLRRIWANHERDERKLRRKEALVAKQKVILYGVNNYADIDEERAKKLAEDLDHLDGLKLSVQHCEEVMKENADRYPLLEKMYGVLKQRNDDLKRDIAYYKEEIARLEAEENN